MKAIVNTDKAPSAIGPYSQAVKAGGFLFVSGQIPVVPATGEVVAGGVKEQTKQSLENLMAILNNQGLTAENVIKTTVFIKDMNDFGKINAIYGQYFMKDAPARACVEVARLPKDVLVEIEAVAVLS
ncbi:2-iminobutanoate/2-iminopropanoate deaminase [Sporomusaceae bacterium BoRhaA]|uniref:RidA family protein n=1 Tax=Pelorhabdus rhamnosifermentans TaxID=2772457 RepID=UPI001C05F018|nr:RidA family protein [Pelorhabdus rhamnosifermentans]MBU2702647.1 2-iminobutanoate/2-iminopropanoate deaminase [Pelorhabdus rhamnosifermentans]